MASAGTVLVVDDYEPNRSGLRALLEAAGYAVYTASNGADALRIAHDVRPDVVLLDVIMPGISGVDVCARLKSEPATRLMPVVVVSGSNDRNQLLAGLEAGADDFLHKPIDAEALRVRVRSLIRVKRLTDDLESAEALFLTLGRIVEARDPYTEGHCERLAQYATRLGAALGLDAQDLEALHRGAFLHDVGKIAVPDRVLLKKTRLTPAEYESMKEHPIVGDGLCRTLGSLEAVRPIIRHHHERRDGRGYPDGLSGDAIPLLATIVSIVDVFDALTTDRPYRRALPVVEAYRILLEEAAGGWCPEALVQQFIELHRSEGVSVAPAMPVSEARGRRPRRARAAV